MFIRDEYLKEGVAKRSVTDEITQKAGIDKISLENSISVPDIPGECMVIEGAELSRKEEALRKILE